MRAERLAPSDLEACRALLAHGSKSFSKAAILLPREMRTHATVLYAFCRVADDAIDESTDPARNHDLIRRRLDLVYARAPIDDPVDRALAAVVAETSLPRAPLDMLLEGFAWDVEARHYETEDDLVAYAVRVAGAVGVAMTRLMGPSDPHVLARACDLGVAMQLTNVARDVGEDARRGRCYLPSDWLEQAGVDRDELLARPSPSPALSRVVERLLNRADELYARADVGVAMLPARFRSSIYAARLVYSDIGRVIREAGYDTITSRAHVSGRRKGWLVARSLGARFLRVDEFVATRPPLGPAADLVAASSFA